MERFNDTPFSGTLEVVATLRDQTIRASLVELREQDKLTVALRSAIRSGVRVEDLSSASGLTVDSINSRVERDLSFGEDGHQPRC